MKENNVMDTSCILGKTVVHIFEDVVKSKSTDIAIRYENQSITYDELNKMSNRIGFYLRNIVKVKTNEIVAIIFEPSLEMVMAILGVIKSGAAYLPIDPTYPKERIEEYISNARVSHALTSNYKEFNESISIHEIKDCIEMGKDSNLPIINKSSDICYAIYTSGTTGKPKAVLIKHIGVINLALWEKKYTEFKKDDSRILQFANYIFDASVWEIFTALLNGICLEILSDTTKKNPKKVLELFKNSRLLLIPTYFRALIQYAKENQLLQLLASFEKLILGAEEVPIDLLQETEGLIGNKVYDIYNYYGPTEITCIATACKYTSKLKDYFPIGKPIDNMKVYIVSKENSICPKNVEGEICIGGYGVSIGYLNNDKLTNEKFVEIAIENNKMERVYKTGDLGKMLNDGNIKYLGRIDNQVKVRGYRIELGEIENKIRKLDYIKDAVVIMQKKNNNQFICAYILTEKDITSIRDDLKRTLPEYMIPQYYMVMDSYPITSTGKLDRKNFPLPEEIEDYICASESEEEIILNIFKAETGNNQVDKNSDFFDIGGNSISAISIISKLKKRGYEIDINCIYNCRTIGNIICHIKDKEKINNGQYNIGEKYILSKQYFSDSCYLLKSNDYLNSNTVKRVLFNHIEPLIIKRIKKDFKIEDIDSLICINEYVDKEFIFQSDEQIVPYLCNKLNLKNYNSPKSKIVVNLVYSKTASFIIFVFNRDVFDNETSYNFMNLFIYSLKCEIDMSSFPILPISYDNKNQINLFFKKVTKDYKENHRYSFWERITNNLSQQKEKIFKNVEKGERIFEKIIINTHTVEKLFSLVPFSPDEIFCTIIARAYAIINEQKKFITIRKIETLEKNSVYISDIVGNFQYDYPIILERDTLIKNNILDIAKMMLELPAGMGYRIYCLEKNEKDEIRYDFAFKTNLARDHRIWENYQVEEILPGVISDDALQIVLGFEDNNFILTISYNSNMFHKKNIYNFIDEIKKQFSVNIENIYLEDARNIKQNMLKHPIEELVFNKLGIPCIYRKILVDNRLRSVLFISRLDFKLETAVKELIGKFNIEEYPDYILNKETEIYLKNHMTSEEVKKLCKESYSDLPVIDSKLEIAQFDRNISGEIIAQYIPSDIQFIFINNPIFLYNKIRVRTLNKKDLFHIIRSVIREQSIFRTTIANTDKPLLYVHESPQEPYVAYIDGRNGKHIEAEQKIKEFLEDSEIYQNYREHALCRVILVRLTEKEYMIHLLMHHCVWDNSSSIIFKQLIEQVGNNNCKDYISYSLYADESHRIPNSENTYSRSKLIEFKNIEGCISKRHKNIQYVSSNKMVLYLEDSVAQKYNENLWRFNFYIASIIAKANCLIDDEKVLPILLLQDDRKLMKNNYSNTMGLCLDMVPLLYNLEKEFEQQDIEKQIANIEQAKAKDHYKYFKQMMNFNYEESNMLCVNFVNGNNMEFEEIYEIAYNKMPDPSLEISIYAYSNYLVINFPLFDACKIDIPNLIKESIYSMAKSDD